MKGATFSGLGMIRGMGLTLPRGNNLLYHFLELPVDRGRKIGLDLIGSASSEIQPYQSDPIANKVVRRLLAREK